MLVFLRSRPANIGAGALLLLLVTCTGCAGSAQVVKSDANDSATWKNRSVWTEKHDDQTFVMAVGSASNASLDRTTSMDSAEQNARERVAIYLRSTVQAFRERLTRKREAIAKKPGGDEASGAAEVTKQDDSGGRTIADQAISGLEVINSEVEKDTDTLFVLARLDLAALRSVLAQDVSLTESERKLVAQNADEVRGEMDQALEQVRQAKQ
jgi:hypothetical protein